MLHGLKAYLEHGLKLNLITNKFPQHQKSNSLFVDGSVNRHNTMRASAFNKLIPYCL